VRGGECRPACFLGMMEAEDGGRSPVLQDHGRNYLFTVINSGRMIRRTIITCRLPAQLSGFWSDMAQVLARGLAHGRR
jgi:hypothetical protein